MLQMALLWKDICSNEPAMLSKLGTGNICQMLVSVFPYSQFLDFFCNLAVLSFTFFKFTVHSTV